MSDRKISQHPVLARRLAHGWSQADLAKQVGISRAAVSAIEGQRLSPSVATALALADVFTCSVEELFRLSPAGKENSPEWAWAPHSASSRYWEAQVGRRCLLYPVEAHGLNLGQHDGVWNDGVYGERQPSRSEETLVLASCDPGAGILAAEYGRETGFRLLVFPRAGLAALELLRQGLIHVAALHRSTPNAQQRNARTVRERLGDDFQLLRAADWEEGLVVRTEVAQRSLRSVAQQTRCWAARELGSGARECLDELLGGRRLVGREVSGHESVAEAVRSGWAGAGVCVRFAAEDSNLRFLPIRKESLDFCFPTAAQQDPRIKALIRLLRTRGYRRLVSELPGYDARHTGELTAV